MLNASSRLEESGQNQGTGILNWFFRFSQNEGKDFSLNMVY